MAKSIPFSLSMSTKLIKLDRNDFESMEESMEATRKLYLAEKRAIRALLLMIGRAVASGSLAELQAFAEAPISSIYKAS